MLRISTELLFRYLVTTEVWRPTRWTRVDLRIVPFRLDRLDEQVPHFPDTVVGWYLDRLSVERISIERHEACVSGATC